MVFLYMAPYWRTQTAGGGTPVAGARLSQTSAGGRRAGTDPPQTGGLFSGT
jgi:hypothetical protein